MEKHVSDYAHNLMITLFELIIPFLVFFERSVADGVRYDFIRTEEPTTRDYEMIYSWANILYLYWELRKSS